jgi:hypothetical protein
MFSRVLIFCSCLFVLGGCIYNEEQMPKIVHGSDSEPKLAPLAVTRPERTQKSFYRNIPRDWLPPSALEKRWIAIVIHHSGTANGNAAIFDKRHREENYWDGVGYDFVIGNGTDSGDGRVEVTFRWRKQITGAHCGGTPGNWANKDAVGICLVGNFNNTVPTARQMQSLVKLTRFLQKRYRISKNRIYSHNTTPGARVTDCAGKNFSIAKLKSILDS